MKKSITGILILVLVILLAGCGVATEPDTVPAVEKTDSTQIDEIAVQEYTAEVITELRSLYDKFEKGEANAERISEERKAPYQMAIGSMAEVRAVADRIEAKLAPSGAEEIRSITITELRELQAGLDEIASKGSDQVALTDPGTFYRAYLDVLIEIPELIKRL